MITIYKYQLKPITEQTISVPNGARVLKVDAQKNIPMLWALVDTDNPPRELEVRIICTGEEISKPLDGYEYLGTYQLCGGDFIHHVFIKK